MIIDPVAFEHLEPGCTCYALSVALILRGIEFGVFILPQSLGSHEGEDVHTDAVVEVRVPADGLFGQRLLTHENFATRLAFQNELNSTL